MVLEIAGGGDHGGVVSAKPPIGDDEADAAGLAQAGERRANVRVGGHATRQHQGIHTAGGGGQRHVRLLDDTAHDGVGIGGGEVGAAERFTLLRRRVNDIECGGFESAEGKVEIVALDGGAGEMEGLGVTLVCQLVQCGTAGIGHSDDAPYTVKFAAGQKQTLEEKYLELSPEARGWYDEIMKYAANVEGSKRFKNARYEEYKVGNSRIIRMLIKRGVINCEFALHNQNFKNYVNENKISVKQSATTLLIEGPETVEAAKNSIDIVIAQIAEEREYKKQLAREKRKAAKEAAAAEAAKEAESAKK